MKLYIFIETSDLEELNQHMITEWKQWLGDADFAAEFVQNNMPDEVGEQLGDFSEMELGMVFNIKQKQRLKEPLNFLYQLAKTYRCEFVIGIIDNKTNEKQDVCYFGHEEGKPDLYEVANYLGL